MQAGIIPAHFEKEPPRNALPNSRVPWPYALACCLYYLLVYRGLASATPIFAKLHEGLGMELPLPTRLLMANYSWLFPLLFVSAVILTITKQLISLEKLRLRIANLYLIFVGVGLAPLAILVLYLPLFILIHRLHNVK